MFWSSLLRDHSKFSPLIHNIGNLVEKHYSKCMLTPSLKLIFCDQTLYIQFLFHFIWNISFFFSFLCYDYQNVDESNLIKIHLFWAIFIWCNSTLCNSTLFSFMTWYMADSSRKKRPLHLKTLVSKTCITYSGRWCLINLSRVSRKLE